MLEKFLKEHEGNLLRAGNIILAIAFVLSFLWFILFSFKVINQAIISNGLNSTENNGFHLDAFAEIKPLFERKGVGFSVLQTKNVNANPAQSQQTTSAETDTQKKIKRNE